MTTDENKLPEPIEGSDAALDAEPVLSHRALRRIGWVLVAVLVLILLSVLPPLLNVSRYQRRVAFAISSSIGRPVHFDAIHLHLLPLPGLTIQNFVVDEDPAFGFEPTLRANTVEARLRLASLWRRRVEVSHIKLLAPSINLVRRSDGRWNLQGVVTQAGYLQNAPTSQGTGGSTPRFPYIEATDARINIKAGVSKLPWSLLDAKLALWLPDENEWRVRLSGRPLRTDTDVSDVGDLELEGSLGRGSGGVTDQPLAISARWASTPLGEAAKLVVGHDTGFRGASSAELEIRGTPAHMQISSDLHLHNLRRTEFVPRLPMSLDAHCQAQAQGIVRALGNIRCAIPTTSESAGLFQGVFRSHDDPQPSAAPGILFLQAEIPDLLTPSTATATADLHGAQPDYLLNWARVLSSRIPENVAAAGAVSLHTDWNVGVPHFWTLDLLCHCVLTPGYPPTVPGANDSSASSPASPASPADVADANSGPARDTNQTWVIHLARQPVQTGPDSTLAGSGNISILAGIAPSSAPPADPRPTTEERVDPLTEVQGHLNQSTMTLQYASSRLARYVAGLFPPLGDNLPGETDSNAPTSAPVQSDRVWGQPQTWTTAAPAPAETKPRKHNRR